MRFQIPFTVGIIFTIISASAQASGLKYTTMGSKYKDLKPKPVEMRSLNFEKEKAKAAALQEQSEQEKTAVQSAWDKYKELAMGATNIDAVKKLERPEEKITEEIKPEKISVNTPNRPNKPVVPKTGMAGIFQQYEAGKARRSQMRSLSFGKKDEDEKQ